ncbi:MAG: ABC transporter ATP-binding protein [Candidatus Omnitrophica bacterium]|nr:ABC transporter ATP-binding protein [Candidatus Omnitrophota bacterium]
MSKTLLEIKGLKTHFYTSRGVVKAVDGIDLIVKRGETVGLVGESGCGKTVTGLSIIRLISEPGRIVEGKVIFDGDDLLGLKKERMRKIRGEGIGMVFQEPLTSLNPVLRIGDQLTEAVIVHRKSSAIEAEREALALLDEVKIDSPKQTLWAYPHQLSGGMRQRVGIAMALMLKPKLVLFDEPTTALDVTVQSGILQLLKGLRQKMGLSSLFITHDLSVAAQLADRIVVMYAGKVVEDAKAGDIFKKPRHPYTKGLLDSIPKREDKGRLRSIAGSVPDLMNLPKGCPFHPRCPLKESRCEKELQDMRRAEEDWRVRCWKAA